MTEEPNHTEFALKCTKLSLLIQGEIDRLKLDQEKNAVQIRRVFVVRPGLVAIVSLTVLAFLSIFYSSGGSLNFGNQYSSGATALCIFYLVGILFIGANLALAVFCIFRVDKPTKLTTSALVQLHSLNDYIKMLESLQKPDRNDFQDLDKLLKQLERRYENICSVIDTIASISDERTLPRKLAVKGSVQSKTTD
ncbi:MAG: hypothetical protein K2X77_29565 [Candidatus Obscuribacterales bacterium]|jgi:hypothetical protein|nr:hypothetical protein [Candidatus Obscuribacterales bacterium]